MYQNVIDEIIGEELITVQEVKDYCRIDTNSDDTLIGTLITSARIQIENYLSRDIISKARRQFVDYTKGRISLNWGPITSVTEVQINDVAITNYTTQGVNEITVILNQGPAENVTVLYITYGINDAIIKQALLQLVSTLYDNRTDFVEGKTISTINTNTKAILAGYRNVFI